MAALFRFFVVFLLLLSSAWPRPVRAVSEEYIFGTAAGIACGVALISLVVVARFERARRRYDNQQNAWHDRQARLLGARHIGHGIYFHAEKFLGALPPEVLAFIQSEGADPLEVAKRLSGELQGDYDPDHAQEDYSDGIDAVLFLRGQSPLRGVCRHKAKILMAVLNYLGIEAINQDGGMHEWVVLLNLQIAVDPTNGAIADADEYLKLQERLWLDRGLQSISVM